MPSRPSIETVFASICPASSRQPGRRIDGGKDRGMATWHVDPVKVFIIGIIKGEDVFGR